LVRYFDSYISFIYFACIQCTRPRSFLYYLLFLGKKCSKAMSILKAKKFTHGTHGTHGFEDDKAPQRDEGLNSALVNEPMIVREMEYMLAVSNDSVDWVIS
jgi:hypothetical protein